MENFYSAALRDKSRKIYKDGRIGVKATWIDHEFWLEALTKGKTCLINP